MYQRHSWKSIVNECSAFIQIKKKECLKKTVIKCCSLLPLSSNTYLILIFFQKIFEENYTQSLCLQHHTISSYKKIQITTTVILYLIVFIVTVSHSSIRNRKKIQFLIKSFNWLFIFIFKLWLSARINNLHTINFWCWKNTQIYVHNRI